MAEQSSDISLNDSTRVPLKWIFALCSIIATYAIYSGKEEIKQMSGNMYKINENVSTLLTERDYTKRDIEALKAKTGDHDKLIWEIKHGR